MANIKKILFVIPYRGIGDIIYHVPIFKALYKKYNSKFTVITNKSNKANYLIAQENYIDSIEFENFDRENLIKNSYNLIKKINSINANTLILTHGSKRLTLPIMLTNAAKKIYFGRHKNEDLASFLINQFKQKFPKVEFDKNYELSNINIENKNSIFLSIDSNHNQNNWGENKYIDLINNLKIQYPDFKIYINFAPHNKKFFEKLTNKFLNTQNIFYTDNCSFDKIIKLISECNFMIGNESGPTCVAALLKKKTFSFFDYKTTPQSSKTIYEKVEFFPNSISADDFINYLDKII